ncbi:DUF7660 family protein [Streptomyces cinereoruber]|uniref:DUF7660 family protein n=1 Tax=Streptomyces cinereoruber TaxID=67260 RepID=UPI00362E3ED5
MNDLHELSNAIRTREDLANFLKAAGQDALANPHDWKEDSLSRFFEAWSAWVDDCPGWFAWRGETTPEQPSWWLIGQMVMAAKIYE